MNKSYLALLPLICAPFWFWPHGEAKPALRQTHGIRLAHTKVNVAPAPPAPPRPPSLHEALAADDLCAALHANWSLPATAHELLRALGFDYDAKWRVLTTDASPLDGAEPEADYGSEAATFFAALRWAGWIGGPPLPVPDLGRAADTLAHLHQEDPRNAAYLIFLLAANAALGRPQNEQLGLAQELWTADHFTTFSADLYREVLIRMRESPSKFIAGTSFLGTMPMPNYAAAIKVLRALEPEVPGMSVHVAALMVIPGLQARESFNLGGYNSLEYAVGRKLMAPSELPSGPELEAEKIRPTKDVAKLFAGLNDCGEETRKKVSEFLHAPN